MSTLREKTADLQDRVEDAKTALNAKVAEIQSQCEHAVILKYTSSDYLTTRACEECGYFERVQWDASYRYKDQRLTGRAYEVGRKEILQAQWRVTT